MAYFLNKTEPDAYSVEHFRRDQQTSWDGVTNAQAVAVIKTMKPGDRVFVYHSGGQSQILALAEVRSLPRPDEKNAKSWVVDLKFRADLLPPTTLTEVKATGQFAGFALVRALLDAGDTRGAKDQMTRLEHLGAAETPALQARLLARAARAEGDSELALRILSRVTVGRSPEIDLESSFEIESDLIELLVAEGRSNDAESHAAMAVQLAKTLYERAQGADDAPLVRLAKAAAKLARLRVASGRVSDAKAVLHEALEAAAARDNDACAARLLAAQAWVASREGLLDQAIELGDRALEHARRCGDRTASARIAANLGVWRTRAGDRDGARLHLELARRYARAMGWHKGTDLARNALRELDAPSAVA